jgi:hypothetical protein
MNGEHPLDRKLRDKQTKADAEATATRAAEQYEKQTSAHATQAWQQHDEPELKDAIGQWNARLEVRQLPQRFQYAPEPQAFDDLFRAHVVCHDTRTGASTQMNIRVVKAGNVAMSFGHAISASDTYRVYAAGQVNRSTWDQLLLEMHNKIAP